LEAGFTSAHAIPMRLRGVVIGALNLFGTDAYLSEPDVIAARALADVATIAILQHRAALEAHELNEQLSGALRSRVVIEQAKGVVAERAGLDMQQAFSLLRKRARDTNRRLADVAQSVVDGTLELGAPNPRLRR
jgi:AmiR/NasT family two-component response regulator